MSDILDFDTLDTAAASEKPYEFELVHPNTKAPLGVYVSVVGPESDAFKAKIRKEINRERQREFQAQRNPSKAAGPQTIEEDEAFSVSLLSDLVKGWRTVKDGKSEPVIYWKGEKFPFNAENLTRWLTHFPWVRVQINDAASDIGNFLGN